MESDPRPVDWTKVIERDKCSLCRHSRLEKSGYTDRHTRKMITYSYTVCSLTKVLQSHWKAFPGASRGDTLNVLPAFRQCRNRYFERRELEPHEYDFEHNPPELMAWT